MDVKRKPYSDQKRWITIYPAYIDAKKSTGEGRRIRKDKAVERPTSQEIYDIVNHLGFNCVLEVLYLNTISKLPLCLKIKKDKMYPRDTDQKGRVRVQTRNDDGTFTKNEFQTSF
ncbi:unnamed protein product [Meloidogyne enterolobii]|uniref:Uncharacterized protein n=1 Tax=Meloidogyne enterolobii TaxID=390850 RepID=A0ACB1B3V1_MELEN